MDNSIVIFISPLTAIMMEQSERFSSVGVANLRICWASSVKPWRETCAKRTYTLGVH